MSNATTSPPTTSTPKDCPTWCTKPAGHSYEAHRDAARQPDRLHVRIVGESHVTVPMGEQSNRDSTALVEISQLETASEQEAGLAQPVITLWAENADLDAAQARQLACLLTRAADQLEEVSR